MASFDPSVIGGIADSQANPVKAQGDAYSLYDEKNRVQLNSLTLQDAKEQQADRLATKNILRASDVSTDKGVNEAAEKMAKVNPEMAMQFKKQAAQQKGMDLDNEYKKMQNAQEQVAPMINSIDAALGSLQDSKKLFDSGKITKAELDARAQKEAFPAIIGLKMNHPELGQYLDQFLKNPQNLTYQGLVSAENQTKDGRDRAKQRMDEIKTAQGQERADTYQKNEQSLEKDRLSLEQHRLASESGERNKPEAGYEWKDDKDHSKGETPIKGGSKDAEKPMTGREAQMFGRIVTSANLGVEALKNIAQLPSGASTGFMGVGQSPGASLIGSAKGVLQNKWSSQEVQDYTSMIAGLSRNLSTIETQGLAPPGSFTQSLSAIQYREGDTQMTKLRKLAEARQIIEFGLGPSLDSPRVSKEQKAGIQKMLDKLQKAIPYTNEDVTKLEADKNPKATMNDVMKQKGLSKDNSQLPPGFVLDK